MPENGFAVGLKDAAFLRLLLFMFLVMQMGSITQISPAM